MSVELFSKDMDIISALPDEPNDVGGLTAAELKAKFDEGGKAIKEYLNTVVYPALSGQYTGDLNLGGFKIVNVGEPTNPADAARKSDVDAVRESLSNVSADVEAVREEVDSLGAEDVGAHPNTWMPTAEEVGARPDTWMPTPAEVGSAPAVESSDHPGCYYRIVDGEIEWINPPMTDNVEYKTAEQWGNKAVYTKRITFTNTTNITSSTTTINVPHGISNLNFMLTADVTTSGYVLPYVTEATSIAITAWSSTNLILYNGKSTWDSGRKWYIWMKYLKNE